MLTTFLIQFGLLHHLTSGFDDEPWACMWVSFLNCTSRLNLLFSDLELGNECVDRCLERRGMCLRFAMPNATGLHYDCNWSLDKCIDGCPCFRDCPHGCPCDSLECPEEQQKPAVLILNTHHKRNPAVLARRDGYANDNLKFELDEDTTVSNSCSLWTGDRTHVRTI